MGTLAVLDVWGEGAGTATAAVTAELARLESLWSRFRPDSDVARLTAAAGRWVEVAPETVALLDEALRLREATRGAFDVTLGTARPPIELREHAVRPPTGCRVDLGGIGKGAAVQRAIALLARFQVRAALVNLGRSSIGVLGTPPGRDRWRVALASPASVTPDRPGDLGDRASVPPGLPRDLAGPHRPLVLAFRDGYLSTSGAAGSHTVDPATGRAPADGVRSTSVLAGDGAAAEAWSTALLVLGLPGLPVAAQAGCEAVLVDAGGRLHTTPGLLPDESED